jgi:predicted dehydrogenase
MKILVVGGGSIGRRHISNLIQLQAGEVICLRRSDDGEFRKKFGIEVVTTWEQAREKGFDAVVLCTPTSLHAEGIDRAIEAGCPLFVEKPLVGSLPEFENVSRKLAAHRGVFYLGYMMRQHPLVRQIRDLIAEGGFGKPFWGRFEFGSYMPGWHPSEDYKISYASRQDLGGGVINTISHETDLVMYFFGRPNAIYTTVSDTRILGIEVEESADSILEFDGITAQLHVDFLQRTYHRSISICCEKGRIDWDWSENKVTVKEAGIPARELTMEQPLEVNSLYLSEMREFLDLAAGKIVEHPLNASYALENTRVLMAMKRSSSTRERIQLG